MLARTTMPPTTKVHTIYDHEHRQPRRFGKPWTNHTTGNHFPPTQLTQHNLKTIVFAKVLTQMTAKAGIKRFGRAAIEALMQEFAQLEALHVYESVNFRFLTRKQRRAALRAINLIKQKRDDTTAYENFLQQAEELVKKMANGGADKDLPQALVGRPEVAVLYRNLENWMRQIIPINAMQEPTAPYGDERLQLALRLDRAMRDHAPAGWKGDDTRENQVLNALFPIMSRNREATEAIFEIIKNQSAY